MHGDFTRFTFDPAKHYRQVLKQQGRVDLDADWNELNDIFDHVDRLTRIDVIGRVGVPIHDPGFQVTFVAGPPALLEFSPGRIYVDGLLVELDPPVPPALPLSIPVTPVPGQKDLVYLDVWERHITAIEDPSIREVALGGPDHCTRVKTEFQIRITPNIGAATCANAPLPTPSTGRLTADVVPTPPSDDPCLIAPSGGYRGLENRLYRVEVHQGGALGVATFKWSRDNGSIVFAVTQFSATQPDRVRVSRLGRDQVLTFRRGDVVEILDDTNELAGTPGTLASIVDIDEAHLELRLSVPVAPLPLSSHPKVRRWDQPSTPSTAIPTGPGPFLLEDGIRIAFSGLGAASDFRTGDYWVFAARTATGTIEGFTNAPPKGIVHHYAALATVLWQPAGPPIIAICPTKFPPLTELPTAEGSDCCCCTVTVGPTGDFPTVSAALAGAPAGSFLVICLQPGVYNLAQPIFVNRDNVILRGCGPLTTLVASPGQPAITIGPRNLVAIESLTIEGGGEWSIWTQASRCRIRDNTITNGGVWVAQGAALVQIVGNRISSPDSPGIALRGLPPGFDPPGLAALFLLGVQIRSNVIQDCADSAIACRVEQADGEFFGLVVVLEILENTIESSGLQGPRLPYLVPGATSAVSGGVFVYGAIGAFVRTNVIRQCGSSEIPACGVMLLSSQAASVVDNQIYDNGAVAPAPGPTGLAVLQAGVVGVQLFDSNMGFAALELRGNTITTLAGPSLFLFVGGSMAITANRLHSARALILPQFGAIGLSLFAGTLAGMPGNDGPGDGRFLFHGNQVSSVIGENVPFGNGPSCRCFFFAVNDLAILDNQFLAPSGRSVLAHVVEGFSVFNSDQRAHTLRVADNRVQHSREELSLATSAFSAIVTGNHFSGKIVVPGALPTTIVANNVEGI